MPLFRRSKDEGTSREPPTVDAAVLVQRGVEHFEAHRWREAVSAFETVLASNPTDSVPHGYLVQVHAWIGNGAAALEHFDAFRAADPGTAARLDDQFGGWLEAGTEVKPTEFGPRQRGGSTYEDFVCGDPEVAKEFLRGRFVDRPRYYIQILTPDGMWGADIDGLYQRQLPEWKTDLSLIECDGSTAGFPSPTGFGYCVQGIADNFTIDVECGRCNYGWLDALRYQASTVVRCPSCGAYNKIDSHHIRSVITEG